MAEREADDTFLLRNCMLKCADNGEVMINGKYKTDSNK